MTTARKGATRAPKPPPLEKVRLQRPHTHQSVPRAAGEVIAVHRDTAAWLRAMGVAAPAQT